MCFQIVTKLAKIYKCKNNKQIGKSLQHSGGLVLVCLCVCVESLCWMWWIFVVVLVLICGLVVCG